jgi:plasmid maintenance system antidote protein VapI
MRERFWLNLQNPYETEVEHDRLSATLDQIEPLATA